MRQAWLEFLGPSEFGSRLLSLTLPGEQFGLHVVRLAARRVISQHLVHHGLRLVEMTRFGSLIDVVHARIGSTVSQYRRSQRNS